MSSAISLILALSVATPDLFPPHPGTLQRLPRLEGRADVTLWRAATPARLIFGRHVERRPVFVLPKDAAAIESLERLGISATLGRWQMVHLGAAGLLETLGSAGDIELRSTHAHRPMLSLTRAEVGAAAVQVGDALSLSRDGSGVLVGIIDTGLDLTHPAFLDADGFSRVVAVWDQDAQSVGDRTPERFGYGVWCSREEIRAERCEIGDPTGHGTHVAGIAAGNDGIAPGADIAVVRSDTFTRLADAVLFLTDVAARRGQPLALNISVGGHYGAHDGKTPLESFLADRLGPGEVLIVAAGNDGAGRLHVGVDLHGDTPQRVGLSNIPWGRDSEITVSLWSQPTADVHLTLELWIDERAVVAIPLDAHGSDFLDGELRYEDLHIADIAFGVELVDEHGMAERSLLIDPLPCSSLPDGATLAIALSGSGRVDGWISQSDYRYGVVRFAESRGGIGGDGVSSVTVPSTSAAAIAVGSYSVRVSWISEAAVEQSTAAVPFGSLSKFSSHGPTLAPEYTGIKPDLVAPGSMIISARAISVAPGLKTIDAARMVLQGTSMAAPHVTGVVALMLEANPRLDSATARAYLQVSARSDGIAEPLPSNDWGWGKLDAAAAVRLAETNAAGCAALPTPMIAGLLMFALLWRRRGCRC